MVHALKLVVYSMTPVWVAGVLNLIPALAPLGIIAALYSVYIFYLGLPVMMETPADKVVPYMAVSALVIIVVSVILGAFAAAVTGMSDSGCWVQGARCRVRGSGCWVQGARRGCGVQLTNPEPRTRNPEPGTAPRTLNPAP
jgi:hypothetical protein